MLATVMGFFSFQRYYNDFIDAMAGGNVAALGPSLLMMGYLAARAAALCRVFVAVVQLAPALPGRGAFCLAHLEWRMFRASGLMADPGAGASCLHYRQRPYDHGRRAFAPDGGSILLMLVFWRRPGGHAAFFVLPAVAVAESALRLCAAPGCCRLEIWRLLAVLLAIFGPILVLFTGLEMVLRDGPLLWLPAAPSR